jgi:hypothetical protein
LRSRLHSRRFGGSEQPGGRIHESGEPPAEPVPQPMIAHLHFTLLSSVRPRNSGRTVHFDRSRPAILCRIAHNFPAAPVPPRNEEPFFTVL